MSSTLSRSRNAFLRPIKQRLLRWVRKRQGRDTLPITLRSKRLYILPTRVGLTLAFVCFAMLLGAMNYNNSMGFALTFLLAATGLVSMHRCHQNLAGVRITRLDGASVFAGDTAYLDIALSNPSASARYDIFAKISGQVSEPFDLPADKKGYVRVAVATAKRGALPIERIGLQSAFPLMLLQTWAWLYTDTQLVVWPKPVDRAPPLPSTSSNDPGERGSGGDDEFAGLRDYQPGDSPRRIAWKAYARSDTMMSRHFSGSNATRAWIDSASLTDMDWDAALSIMARWILDAESVGDDYGLRLAGVEIAPAHGLAHRNRCLDALALSQPTAPRHA